MFKNHRKYLRFQFQGVVYQFRVLCFGTTTAPSTFVKVISVVVAYSRKLGIRLASYLDDWLALNQIEQYLLQNREKILGLLFQLGFMINKNTSQLVSVQTLTYLGAIFSCENGLAFPTPERVYSLK